MAADEGPTEGSGAGAAAGAGEPGDHQRWEDTADPEEQARGGAAPGRPLGPPVAGGPGAGGGAGTWPSPHGLPPLAGICSPQEAMRPGLAVEECVRRLKRYHYAFRRLHEICTARIPAEPVYELKMAFSLHAHLCAEHVAALRRRVSEMREPPLGLEAVPDAALEVFFDEIRAAPSTAELVAGLYEQAVPALQAALRQHLEATNPLADHPSVRLCRFALLELGDIAAFGARAVAALVTPEARAGMAEWLGLLEASLARAGGVAGPAAAAAAQPGPDRWHSARPYRFDPVPRRDERFPDPYNMGVNAEAFLYDETYPPSAKTLMMYYKRLREIDVPEVMAAIIAQTPGKEWPYYRDMARQLWDEARHALMGEVGFGSIGVDWRKVMINFTWSLGLNTQLGALDRHGVLYFIEQGLMPKTGKRYEWEVAEASGDPLSKLFQDYDWADEVLHARIGRDWYASEFPTYREAVEHGDRCWSQVLMDWGRWREQGLTQHRNWWPEVYREACARRGVAPEPRLLAYHETYENKRADLKEVGGDVGGSG